MSELLEQEEAAARFAPPAPPALAPRGRERSLGRLALEVALIAVGVFLGLMGEQWRERAEHRERGDA